MISSLKTSGEGVIKRNTAVSPVLTNDDQFFDTQTRSWTMEAIDFTLDFGSTSSERNSLVCATKTMSTSALGSGDKGPRLQTSACDQLYDNRSLYNVSHMQMMIHPPIPCSRNWTQVESTANENIPLFKSPSTLDHGSSINYNSSSEAGTITCMPDSCLGTVSELPPVLHLNKHAAAITIPDVICCVINPYP